jgi:putative Holliday junction resolvase
MLASPVGAVERGPTDVHDIVQVADDNHATQIVVGLPLTLAGESRAQAGKVRQFVRELRSATSIPVVTIDERLSTVQAQRLLTDSDQGRRSNRDRGRIDSSAAAVILQSYLDSRR